MDQPLLLSGAAMVMTCLNTQDPKAQRRCFQSQWQSAPSPGVARDLGSFLWLPRHPFSGPTLATMDNDLALAVTVPSAILLPSKEGGLAGVALPAPQSRDLNSLGPQLPTETHGTDFAARRPNGGGNYTRDAGFPARLGLGMWLRARSRYWHQTWPGALLFGISLNPGSDPRREALFLCPFYKPDS